MSGQPPQQILVGGEQALHRTTGGATWLFGLGPATTLRPQPERARALILALAPELGRLAWCSQVHGRELVVVPAKTATAETDRGAFCVGPGDGLLCAHPNTALLVWTADCVPVLLAADGAIAAVHAGWRGSASGILKAAIKRLQADFGVPPERLQMALGPAVGPCHYQVGSEVIEALSQSVSPAAGWLHGDRVDLRSFLTAQARDQGVPPANILTLGGCTACDPGLASYRRDGKTAGRQWALIIRSGPGRQGTPG